MLLTFLSLGIASHHIQPRRKTACYKNNNLVWRALEQSCLGCGRENGVIKGCDGKGRIVGEISKQGGTYQRAGQTLEELFGINDVTTLSTHKQSTKDDK
ncbi:hypothetical protein Gasu2_18930 [Galdieria sulphuraria]|nr:hypothetical protein Gasu2_18930 [Galdieria sulphuraria]